MAATRPITVGQAGQGGDGKSTFAWYLAGAAGLKPELIEETSHRIVPLAELFRSELMAMLSDGHDLTVDYAPWLVLTKASDWLRQVTDGMVDIPPEAIDLRRASTHSLELLNIAMSAVQVSPSDFVHEVTVLNKSSDLYRPLLSGVNVVLSELAIRYLNHTQGLRITNIWPWIAMRMLDEQLERDPTQHIQIVSGLRMPYDDRYVRDIGGIIIERQRFGDREGHPLLTERRHFDPDYIIFGETPLDVLEDWVKEVLWPAMQAGHLPPPHGSQPVTLHVGQPLPSR